MVALPNLNCALNLLIFKSLIFTLIYCGTGVGTSEKVIGFLSSIRIYFSKFISINLIRKGFVCVPFLYRDICYFVQPSLIRKLIISLINQMIPVSLWAIGGFGPPNKISYKKKINHNFQFDFHSVLLMVLRQINRPAMFVSATITELKNV